MTDSTQPRDADVDAHAVRQGAPRIDAERAGTQDGAAPAQDAAPSRTAWRTLRPAAPWQAAGPHASTLRQGPP